MSFDLKLVKGNLSIKNGSIETVSGSEKLIQDILKIALTNVGANPNNPWYGSYVSKSLIGSSLDEEITITIAQSQLQTAIETLRKLQQRQAESFQSITADEHIASIIDISIERNNSDPRLFNVVIKVLSKALKQENAQFSVRNF